MATEVESGAEMAGSESRVDVAPKDESAGIAADWRAEVRRMIEEAKIKMKQMLKDWEVKNPGRKAKMAHALATVRPSHLHDPALFGFNDLLPETDKS